MTEHQLKLGEKYFDAVKNGIKTFEVRRNDRDYKVGDTLVLEEVDDDGEYICESTLSPRIKRTYATIVYILTHDDFPGGVPEGYVVMSIKVIG